MRARVSPWIAFAPLPLLLSGCQPSVAWPAVKQAIRAEFPTVDQIGTAELNAWLESDEAPPLLLDVRKEAEYRVSHLRGAVRVEPGGLPTLPPGVDKDTPIVTYCSVGYRSSALAARLVQQGYTAVSNLEGSIFQWANQKLPVVRDGREVTTVHPYSRRWQGLLDEELRAYSVD